MRCRSVERVFEGTHLTEAQTFASKYEVTPRKLGCGAYGKVFMAIDKSKKTQVACKIVDLRALKSRYRQQSKSPFFETANRPFDMQFEDKLAAYTREARILETIRHVSGV